MAWQLTKLEVFIQTNQLQQIIVPLPSNEPPPAIYCEVFVSSLPEDLYEDELVAYFSRVGEIQRVCLMGFPSKTAKARSAFITYVNPEQARLAVRILDNTHIRPGRTIRIHLSLDPCKLFIRGIPISKSKDEVWHELMRNNVKGIVDIVMHKAYSDRKKNRGFVFVEFPTHQAAAHVKFLHNELKLFGEPVFVDWSRDRKEAKPDEMATVTKLFIRNLQVIMDREDLVDVLARLRILDTTEKVYKFKNYAFVHYASRIDAEHALQILTDYYQGSDVEITWAVPMGKSKKKNLSPQCSFECNTWNNPNLLPNENFASVPFTTASTF